MLISSVAAEKLTKSDNFTVRGDKLRQVLTPVLYTLIKTGKSVLLKNISINDVNPVSCSDIVVFYFNFRMCIMTFRDGALLFTSLEIKGQLTKIVSTSQVSPSERAGFSQILSVEPLNSLLCPVYTAQSVSVRLADLEYETFPPLSRSPCSFSLSPPFCLQNRTQLSSMFLISQSSFAVIGQCL